MKGSFTANTWSTNDQFDWCYTDPTSSWVMQSGHPLPDSSNKLCATNGQQGSVVGSSALCDGAQETGSVHTSPCMYRSVCACTYMSIASLV